MRCADRAWAVLGLGVLAYELLAPPGELLSEGVDRYLEAAPWPTRAIAVYTVAHLLNLLPERVDLFHHFAVATGRGVSCRCRPATR